MTMRPANVAAARIFCLDGLQAGPGAAKGSDDPVSHQNCDDNKSDGDAGCGPRMLRDQPGETDGDAVFSGA